MTACNSWNAHDDSISLQWNNALFTVVATCFRQKHEVSRQAQGIDGIENISIRFVDSSVFLVISLGQIRDLAVAQILPPLVYLLASTLALAGSQAETDGNE